MEAAVEFFRRQMLGNWPARKPSITFTNAAERQAIKIWGLGYAPDSWNALLDHLLAKGYNRELILQAT